MLSIMKKNIKLLYLLLFVTINTNCNQTEKQASEKQVLQTTPDVPDVPDEKKSTTTLPVRKKNELPINDKITFPWLPSYEKANILMEQIFAPPNAARIKSKPESFATWLRHLPLHPASKKVALYNGKLKGDQSTHHRIINMDVGTRDLQQCADAVMRLKAEYHFYKKEYAKIHFNYTSGDKVSFEDWRFGKRPVVKGNAVSFTEKSRTSNSSYTNFKKYMRAIFNYAGTASLEKELQQVPFAEMQVGDVFIQGGFPGHAVLVVDMAEDVAAGKKYFLLAQSYMPAQEMHVLKNPMDEELSPWYDLDREGNIGTPEWNFMKKHLMRF